jgi:tetratricopeptide (TPR) repeat protein
VKKQQLIVIGSGVVLFCLIYFFGTTTPPKQASAGKPSAGQAQAQQSGIDIKTVLAQAKQELSPEQQSFINKLEAGIVRGDLKEEQVKVYKNIAGFWKDSAHMLLPYAYYTALASKLENSEKSLTFAAHYFLEGVRQQPEPELKKWMALQAKELFEQALTINPSNDSSKVGLGSCYLFGGISEAPMQGIQMIREVAERDTTNMYAQFMLGLGGIQSGQFDKAIERLSKVVRKQPKNVEAIITLAEAYERTGDKANAAKYYEASKSFFKNDPAILKEIDQRINDLKK